MTELGYDATLRLSRVGDPQAAPRTHLGVVVTFDGVRHLADPGIGVPPLAPIPLVDGAVLPGGIWAHEIRQVAEGPSGPGWQLWRQRSSGWELMHTTDELPVRPVDVAMGHHFTSTAPTSHFRHTFTLARHGVADDGTPTQTTVTLDGVTERRAGSPSTQRPFDLDELPELLERLGANLTADETTRLQSRLASLTWTEELPRSVLDRDPQPPAGVDHVGVLDLRVGGDDLADRHLGVTFTFRTIAVRVSPDSTR